MSLLEVKDLQIAFKNKKNKNKPIEVIDNVSFSLEDDEILGIVGESGCGKTTLSRGILKVINHRSGNIIIDGKPIEEISRGEMSEKIQMIFQNPLASFNPRYTIKHSLYETARVHKIKQADIKKELQQLYEYTGLTEEMASKYPGQLSGGQLQRFAIVRALIVKPKIIIADEAVAALDVSIQTDILNLLLYLRKKLHIAILFISHDLRVVKNICDRVLVMYLGTVFEFGNTQKIFDHPLHPYTRLLLASRTKSDPGEIKKETFKFEDIPSILDLPEGCRFGLRCEYAKENGCICEKQPLSKVEDGHYIACNHYEENEIQV